jgi:hypothetical protein
MRIQNIKTIPLVQTLQNLGYLPAFFQQAAPPNAKASVQFMQSLPLGLQVKGGIIVMGEDILFPTEKGQQFFALFQTCAEALVVVNPKIPFDPPKTFHFRAFPLAAPRHFMEQYTTSSQIPRDLHFFRLANERPQCRQILVSKGFAFTV